MKGRVLTVDAGSSKATLTLKRSLVKDKREAVTSYQEVRQATSSTTGAGDRKGYSWPQGTRQAACRRFVLLQHTSTLAPCFVVMVRWWGCLWWSWYGGALDVVPYS